MSTIERLTVTMPSELAAVVKEAIAGGDYASTSEVVREALRDWKTKRALQLQELAGLKADIDKGLAEVAAGRVTAFDADKIIERGEEAISDTLALRLTDAAEADLAEIWVYIALEASEAIATRFLTTIEEQFGLLLRFPLSGSKREHFAPGLRVIFHGAYAVYYILIDRELIIVRVLHGARDAAALAERGGFVE